MVDIILKYILELLKQMIGLLVFHGILMKYNHYIQPCDFPGSNEYSIGLSSTGKIWYNNTNKVYIIINQYYCPVLRSILVIGLLIDLNLGYISFIIDGRDYGPSIGWGSETFNSTEREKHINVIRNKIVYPAFALKGEFNANTPNTPNTPTVNRQSNINLKTLLNQQSSSTITQTINESNYPRLSVNFGLFDFLQNYPDAFSCDNYTNLKKHNVFNNNIRIMSQ